MTTPRPGRLTRAWRGFGRRYLTIDPRTAALFRIAYGTMLCFDCLRHWREAQFLYSNEGVLANHFHLYKPTTPVLFSFFNAFSTLTEVHILFAIGLACHVALVLGYKTRLVAIASFLWVTSRDSRMLFVENGGYVVQNLACMWACFLPLGERFSIDAWRASWRAHKETTLEELTGTAQRTDRPHRSLIMLAVIANLSIVYFFNVVNKTGHLWRAGESVHYVLHINRMVTGLSVFVREHLPLALLKIADFAVLAVEATIFVTILSPYGRRVTRLVALGLIVGLHTTLGLFMRLGPFSWILIAWSTLLLLPIHFQRLEQLERRGNPSGSRELGLDTTDAFAMTFGRIVARLDRYHRVRFVPAPTDARLAVRTAPDAPWISDPRALCETLAPALPFGRWIRTASLGLIDRVVVAAFARRDRIVSFFGMNVAPALELSAGRGPARWLGQGKTVLRETLLAYLIACATAQAWIENKVIPKSLPPPLKEGQVLRPDERQAYDFIQRTLGGRTLYLKPDPSPELLSLTVTYPRTFQGWGMFAPNPIRDDGVLAVDALTIDGRHLDPLTGRAPDLNLADSRGEGLSQLRQDYGNRIRMDRNAQYRDGLRDYILRLPERTGNPNDKVIAIDVYWVKVWCPAPGTTQPTENDAIPILSYRLPKYIPGPGQPALPPPLTIRSAEKFDSTPAADGAEATESAPERASGSRGPSPPKDQSGKKSGSRDKRPQPRPGP